MPQTTPQSYVLTALPQTAQLNLAAPDAQGMVDISGPYALGTTLVIEGSRNAGTAAPTWFQIATIRASDKGQDVMPASGFAVPDNTATPTRATRWICDITGCNVFRLRPVVLQGSMNVDLSVGSFFSVSPTPPGSGGVASVLNPATGQNNPAFAAVSDAIPAANVPAESAVLWNGMAFERARVGGVGQGDTLVTSTDERHVLDLLYLEMVRIRVGIGILIDQDLSDVSTSEDVPV